MISVVILTLNEEVNIERCIKGLGFSDDIVVFDSFSSDRTVEIAKLHGARVVQRRFDNYGAQREAARTEVSYKHLWVLSIDADEQPDDHLVRELLAVASAGRRDYAAFRVRRKDHFKGRWIRWSSLYPSWFLRFYQPERIRYENRAVHEYPLVLGPVGTLAGHLLHDNLSKGIIHWIQKHRYYALLEAQAELKELRSGRIDLPGLFSVSEPVRRRRALKQLSMRLPLRSGLRFLYMYVLRCGFLDGNVGLEYCRLLATYEWEIARRLRVMYSSKSPRR